MRTHVYIDASNLYYGGKKSLGWSIDYRKLKDYLEDKYQASVIYYFGGVEAHKFPFNSLQYDSVPIEKLEGYLSNLIDRQKANLAEEKLALLEYDLKKVHFYKMLEKFGYNLILKPVKTFKDEGGGFRYKANCDVDMAFYMMRDYTSFDRAIVLSGDGDFLPVLKFLREKSKKVLILSRGPRTAKEIRKFAGGEFRDFEYLRAHIEFTGKG